MTNIAGDSLATMENSDFVLKIRMRGGSFVDFHLKNVPSNPFTWYLTPDQMPENNRPYGFAGHFLCTGRWGEPSPGEIAAGIPHNGEVNTGLWDFRKIASDQDDIYQVYEMSCESPIEKFSVSRRISVPNGGNYFIVRESFRNQLPIGRIHNVVQHGTIAAPFLTESTIINTNATLGFDQRTGYAHLEDSSFIWPDGNLADGNREDLRLVTSQVNFVTSHIFDDSIGWVTALNPEENLLLGYVWHTAAYPWLNIWHHTIDGKSAVQGMEFGTTGLGKPYKLLLENNVTFYGRQSFEYIDAGETIEKSWVAFMISVPNGFRGVESISFSEDSIEIHGKETSLQLSGRFVL